MCFFCGNFHPSVSAATNKQKSASRDTAKLDRETEELHRKQHSPLPSPSPSLLPSSPSPSPSSPFPSPFPFSHTSIHQLLHLCSPNSFGLYINSLHLAVFFEKCIATPQQHLQIQQTALGTMMCLTLIPCPPSASNYQPHSKLTFKPHSMPTFILQL